MLSFSFSISVAHCPLVYCHKIMYLKLTWYILSLYYYETQLHEYNMNYIIKSLDVFRPHHARLLVCYLTKFIHWYTQCISVARSSACIHVTNFFDMQSSNNPKWQGRMIGGGGVIGGFSLFPSFRQAAPECDGISISHSFINFYSKVRMDTIFHILVPDLLFWYRNALDPINIKFGPLIYNRQVDK